MPTGACTAASTGSPRTGCRARRSTAPSSPPASTDPTVAGCGSGQPAQRPRERRRQKRGGEQSEAKRQPACEEVQTAEPVAMRLAAERARVSMCASPPKSPQTSSASRGSRRARGSGSSATGLPFRSGHVLGLRRFPASSIGPGYRSVWHDPHGRWTFYQDRPAELACTRFFGSAVDEVRAGPIRIDWTAPRGFQVRAGDRDLEWTSGGRVDARDPAFQRSWLRLSTRAWRSRPVLDVMSRVAGTALPGRPRATDGTGAQMGSDS